MSQVSYGTITIVDTTDIERIYMVYAKSVSNTTPPSDELIWSESIASAPGEGDFIWQKTVVEKAITEEKTYSDPVCVTGSSGQGVEKIINYYCNYGQGQPEEDYSGWQLEIPEYDGNKPNYWTKVVVIYSDDTREDFQASGTIATFENEKVGVLDSLEVSLSPIQDLHGYDRPWVGGGNGNLFKATPYRGGYNYSAGTSLKVDTDVMDYEITSDGKISINITTAWRGRLFATDALEAGDYTFRCYGDISGIRASWYITDSDLNVVELVANQQNQGWGSTYTRTITQGQRIALHLGANAVTTLVTEFQVNTGTTIQPIVPFENICPISGWDSVDVSVCGVNVWDEEWEAGGINNTTGQNAGNANTIRAKNYISIHPNTEYFVKSPTNVRAYWYDLNRNYISTVSIGSASPFTTPNDAHYMRFIVGNSANPVTTYNNDISINYPSTDHDYHAHQGQTITTTLPQTVYGGTLDVVSGVLTVTHKEVTFNTSSGWSVAQSNSHYRAYKYMDDIKSLDVSQAITEAISDKFERSTWNDVFTGKPVFGQTGTAIGFGMDDFGITTGAELGTWLNNNPLQVVYPLATPTTIQLTPTQIDSLLGRNNVWSDGTVEVEGHTISKKDIMIYKDNGLTDVANKSAEANTNAAEALEKANDGIISTTQLWYQTNGTSAPNVPTNHSQVDQGTVTYNNWRSVRPNNSVDSYKYYYYCYEYLHGDGTYTYSTEAILDTSNLSQYQIEQLQTRVKKMWSNSTGSYMASGIGTKEIYIDNSSTYGFNSKSTTTGVSFNYNAIPLTSLGTDGIKLYSPTLTNGVITGSRLDATLDTNGLFLNRGGIESGGLSSGNGYVYLSTLDKAGITINGHLPGTNDPKWRAIIGSKFGVDSEGNLYASNANISGNITANNLTINGGATIGGSGAKDILNSELIIGVRNLAIDSTSSEGYLTANASIGSQDESLGSAYDVHKERTTDYIAIEEGETYTMQFWATIPNGYYYWCAWRVYDVDRNCLTSRQSRSGSAVSEDTSWHYEDSITMPAGAAFIRLSMRTYEDGKWKFEHGDKATDWIPALEDTDTNISSTVENSSAALSDRIDGIDDILNGGENNDEGIITQIENINATLTPLENDFRVTLNDMESFMKFKDYDGSPNLVLGSVDSDYNVVITNTRMAFRDQTSVVAYIDQNGLYVQEYLSFGNFQFYQRNNGHFTLKFIGGGDE